MTTKNLAKKLGLLRRRSESSQSSKPLVSGQIFSYLVILDFESTCWREKSSRPPEIIEFPAVLLNTSSGRVESEFHAFVQPQEQPLLSRFCSELTGITQTKVEAGVPLHICLSRFSRWLQALQREKGLVFPDSASRASPSATQGLCSFLTWSDWDLGVCLHYECKRKQLRKPEVLSSWIDLRSTYRVFYGRKPKGLNGALHDLGIQFTGREHSGLDDSRNTARLAARMMMDGCILKTTKRLEKSPAVGQRTSGQTSCSFDNKENLCSRTGVPTTNRPAASRSSHRVFQIQQSLANKTERNPSPSLSSVPWCLSLISPQTLLSGSTGNRPSNSASSSSRHHLVLCSTTVSCSPGPASTAALVEEETEERCGCYDDVMLDEDSMTDSLCDADFISDVQCMDTNGRSKVNSRETVSVGGTPERQNILGDSCVSDDFRSSAGRNRNCLGTVPTSPLLPEYTWTSRTRLVFTAPFPDSTESAKPPAAAPPASSPSSTLTPSSSVRAPTHTHSVSAGAWRPTSPLCGCGRRAMRRLVSNGGPNHGWGFFCCPLRGAARGVGNRGCEFFRWESAVTRSSWLDGAPIRRSASLCQMDLTHPHPQTGRPHRKSF